MAAHIKGEEACIFTNAKNETIEIAVRIALPPHPDRARTVTAIAIAALMAITGAGPGHPTAHGAAP